MVETLAEKRFVALVLLYVVLAENRPRLGIRVLPVNFSLQNPPLPEIIFCPGPLRFWPV